MVLTEAQAVAAASAIAAFLLSLPLTWLLDVLVGQLGFVAPLPFTVSSAAVLVWLVLVLVLAVSNVAAWLPSRRAADLPIALALAEV